MRAMTAILISTIAVGTAARAQIAEPTPAAPEGTPTPAPEASPPMAVPTPAVSTGATRLKIGGALWAIYGYDLTKDAGNVNAFDVGRTYLNVEPSWGDHLSARITPDLVRQTAGEDEDETIEVATNTTGSLALRVKYAYLQYARVLPYLDLRVGIQPTPYVEFEEGIWEHRFLAPVALDAYHKVSSSDAGFGAIARIGRIELQTAVQNGESYSRPEEDKYKEIATRATVSLLPGTDSPGLRLTGYYGFGLSARNEQKARGIALLSYQTKRLTVAGQYVRSQTDDGVAGVDGSGAGAFAIVKLPMKLWLVGRYDMFDPDVDTAGDGEGRRIAGIGHALHEKVRVVLNLQQSTPEDADADDTVGAFAHLEAKF